MSDRLLIPYPEKALVKADRQISIANKALVRIDAERFAKLLSSRFSDFICLISSNRDLPWTETLIDKYKDCWDWNLLSLNSSLPWTETLIEKYGDRLNPAGLSLNSGLPWTETLIEKYEDLWDWKKFSSNDKFLNLITKYGANLIHQILSTSTIDSNRSPPLRPITISEEVHMIEKSFVLDAYDRKRLSMKW